MRALIHDGAGNWSQFSDKVDGSTDVDERSDTSFNEYYEALGETITHDDNGNMSEDGTYEYEWDVFNRLRRIKLAMNGYTVAQYYYDAENRRVRRTAWAGMTATTTQCYYDGWRAIEERVSDTPVRQFVFGNYLDEALCMDVDEDADGDCIESGTDSRYYYHQNGIYSVVAITNADGEIVEAYEYDPYGKHVLLTDGDSDGVVEFDGSDNRTTMGASQESIGNPWTFTGQRFDPEAELHYYKNRYYHCGLGRFVSRDPISDGKPQAFYSYCMGRAIMMVDPSGLDSFGGLDPYGVDFYYPPPKDLVFTLPKRGPRDIPGVYARVGCGWTGPYTTYFKGYYDLPDCLKGGVRQHEEQHVLDLQDCYHGMRSYPTTYIPSDPIYARGSETLGYVACKIMLLVNASYLERRGWFQQVMNWKSQWTARCEGLPYDCKVDCGGDKIPCGTLHSYYTDAIQGFMSYGGELKDLDGSKYLDEYIFD